MLSDQTSDDDLRRDLARLAVRIDTMFPVDVGLVTPVPGLHLTRSTSPTGVAWTHFRPSICLVVQGEMTINIASYSHRLAAGAFSLAALDLNSLACVTAASAAEPFMSVILSLDPAIVREMLPLAEPPPSPSDARHGLAVGMADGRLADAFVRGLALLDRPAEISILFGLIEREIVHRVLVGPEGATLRRIARAQAPILGVLRSIEWLEKNLSQRFDRKTLAGVAGMGVSTLHHKFQELTLTSPLQYQKHLRLHAARELLLTEGNKAKDVAERVGYESAARFGWEYGRFFGHPPGRDIRRPKQSRLE